MIGTVKALGICDLQPSVGASLRILFDSLLSFGEGVLFISVVVNLGEVPALLFNEYIDLVIYPLFLLDQRVLLLDYAHYLRL